MNIATVAFRSGDITSIDARVSNEYGVPSSVLMEQAACNLLHSIQQCYPDIKTLAVCVGAGNNGGDGLALARIAHCNGWTCTVVTVFADNRRLSEQCALQLERVQAYGIPIIDSFVAPNAATQCIANAMLIVDGICGNGIRGSLRREFYEIVNAINNASGAVVAIDVPSGIGDEFKECYAAVRAQRSFSLGVYSMSLFSLAARPYVGTIHLLPLSYPAQLIEQYRGVSLLVDSDMSKLYRPVSRFSHKHRRGIVQIFGGSNGTMGAPLLSADSASAMGIGIVMCMLPQTGAIYANKSIRLRSSYLYYDIDDKPRYTPHAVLCGPGWDNSDTNRAMLRHLLSVHSGVIDATAIGMLSSLPLATEVYTGADATDGINQHVARGLSTDMPKSMPQQATKGMSQHKADSISQQESQSVSHNVVSDNDDAQPQHHDNAMMRRWVLTPHVGELANLLQIATTEIIDNSLQLCLETALRYQTTVVLKGHTTYICDWSGRQMIYDGAHPATGVAGSGDVLAGIIVASMARGSSPFDAACFGVQLHGTAARKLYEQHGFGTADGLVKQVAQEIVLLQTDVTSKRKEQTV